MKALLALALEVIKGFLLLARDLHFTFTIEFELFNILGLQNCLE